MLAAKGDNWKQNQQTVITHPIDFPTGYNEIWQRVLGIDAINYCRSRNYVDGAVTYLSPYISRGVISTKQVFNALLAMGHKPYQIEKLIQELAWRDYWQQVWKSKGNAIDHDLKQPQSPISNHALPKAIVEGNTGIGAIDGGIHYLYTTGYLHNHLRMYIAAIACNLAQSHWKYPAQWMYYYLLDADWASNALSWQWVAGTNSNKKYFANQDNINKYCHTQQKNTFLDFDYEDLATSEIPEKLKTVSHEQFITPLPAAKSIVLDPQKPTCIYNFYNLDPLWMKDRCANRVLLIEPSVFEKYPVSQKSIDFMLALSKNIEGIQPFIGEFSTLVKTYGIHDTHFKEHPLNNGYTGTETPRDWMFDVTGYYPSFFAFWKKCRKQLT